MLFETVELSKNARLTAYVADSTKSIKDAVLIIPGGAYGYVCVDREGEPVALDFLARGYNTFILEYSVNAGWKIPPENPETVYPAPLIEASLAMKYIRDNHERYRINKDRIFAMGFSAGGHLCAMLGNMWHLDEINKNFNEEFGFNKPKGIILGYPVISAKHKHLKSFQNLTGVENPSDEMYEHLSVENHVDERSAPAFIVQSVTDEDVSILNSVVLAEAYAKKNIPFELHIFPEASHGFSVANENVRFDKDGYTRDAWIKENVAVWPSLADTWMKNIK